MAAEREVRGLGLAGEMLPTLAICEQTSVAGGEEGRLLLVFRVSMAAGNGCAFPQ